MVTSRNRRLNSSYWIENQQELFRHEDPAPPLLDLDMEPQHVVPGNLFDADMVDAEGVLVAQPGPALPVTPNVVQPAIEPAPPRLPPAIGGREHYNEQYPGPTRRQSLGTRPDVITLPTVSEGNFMEAGEDGIISAVGGLRLAHTQVYEPIIEEELSDMEESEAEEVEDWPGPLDSNGNNNFPGRSVANHAGTSNTLATVEVEADKNSTHA